MDNNSLVCVNDGRGTRVNITAGTESALDMVSSSLASVSNWDVWTDTTVGSDHYLVSCSVGGRVAVRPSGGISKWFFGKANWDKFQELSEETMTATDFSGDIDEINNQVTLAVITAANRAFPGSKNRTQRKLVPCWTEACSQAVQRTSQRNEGGEKEHSISIQVC